MTGYCVSKEEGEEYDAFTFNDGVPGPTFTNGAYKDEKGLLWFGNTKGLIYVDPKRVDEVRGKVRSIVFTDILANGVPFTSSSLKYNQNNLTFCFTDFAYGLPSALLYEYRLEEWTRTGNYWLHRTKFLITDFLPGLILFV